MSLTHAHAHTDDPLGMATAGDIVLVDLSLGPVIERVEMLAETGFFIDTTGPPKLLNKFTRQANIVYELRSSNLALPFGAVINTDWIIQQCSVDYNGTAYPRVSLSVLELTDAASLGVKGTPGSYTALGGYGAVDVFSVTGSAPVSSQFSISFRTIEAMGVNSDAGKFLPGGYFMWDWRKNYRLDSYETYSAPSGVHATEAPVRTNREGLKIFGKSWFTYVLS